MNGPTDPILLADIGATNARFALLTGGRISEPTVRPVAGFPDAAAAARDALGPVRPAAALIAAAGPVVDGRVVMTNAAWTLDPATLSRDLGIPTVRVINDFAAQAHALPALTGADLFRVGPDAAPAPGPMLVLGPGTGFGLAGLLRTASADVPLITEGGHATLPATDAREAAIIRVLRDRYGHVSVERVLSGAGLVDLYHAIGLVDGLVLRERSAPEIVSHALAGDCEGSVATLSAFCAFLGGVAGNAALTLGATGGVFIGGGIVPRFTGFLAASAFRQRFEAKGRLRPYLAAIGTAVIVHPAPAFLGLRRLAERAG